MWDDMVLVGRVARPQGNRGEVIVDAETDFPEERFAAGASVFVRRTGDAESIEPLAIEGFRMHGGRPVVKFEGVQSISDAEALRGVEMRVPEASLGELPEGVWYHHELIGCRVRTKQDGRDVGKVVAIAGPTERSLLMIDGPEGSAIVPLAAEFVSVDRAAKEIVIDPPEGLLDVNRGGDWRKRKVDDADED